MILMAAVDPAVDIPDMPVTRHVATRMAGAARLDAVTTNPTATVRRFHTVTSWCRNPRLVFGSLSGKSFVLRASIRIGEADYQVTFAGSVEVTVAANTTITSDPIAVTIPPGTKIQTRTYTVRDSTWVGTWQNQLPNIDGEQIGAGDQTAPGLPWLGFDVAGISRGPLALYADAPADHRSVAVVGDSISAGATGVGNSWTTKVVDPSGLAWQSASVGGQKISDIITDKDRRFGPLKLAPFTHHICQHGTNDMSGNDPNTFPWASYLSYWQWCADQGVKVIQATTLPYTTSTDNWATLANQTRQSWGQRDAFNQWLRDGAPIVSGVKVAPGTSGALRAGQAGHPLASVFDAAAAVESTLGSGYWRTDSGSIAGDGLHPSALGSSVIAAAFPPALLA